MFLVQVEIKRLLEDYWFYFEVLVKIVTGKHKFVIETKNVLVHTLFVHLVAADEAENQVNFKLPEIVNNLQFLKVLLFLT